MATTLPSYTETIDNKFVNTWYEIRPQAIDNILLATPIWAAIFNKCKVEQVGGKSIERTIKYATGVRQAITKGTTLNEGEVETETAAFWTWRYISSHIQRTLIDDQQNNGKFKIKSYVDQRLTAARESLVQGFETDILRTETTDESGLFIQSLNDMLPAFANRATGTYGKIARSNDWWVPKYYQWTGVRNINLLSDMRTAYNNVFLNQTAPNLILCTQTLFELYEDFAEDKVQIIKDETTRLVDLGFEVLRFKGKPMIWTPNQTSDNMCMYNTDYIEVVYDPRLWFDMSSWRDSPKQFERLANIVCACNIISTQLRRHIRLYP